MAEALHDSEHDRFLHGDAGVDRVAYDRAGVVDAFDRYGIEQAAAVGEQQRAGEVGMFLMLMAWATYRAITTDSRDQRQEFLRGLNGDYQRLRSDPELWEQYLAERHEWDTLA